MKKAHSALTKNSVEESRKSGQPDPVPVRQELIKIINSKDTEELYAIKRMIQNMNRKSPVERFNEEALNHQWSLKKQAELEYSFYSHSPLKDIGELDSISCKSSLCKIDVSVPSDTMLRPSFYDGWNHTLSMTMHQSNNGQSRIELIILEKE